MSSELVHRPLGKLISLASGNTPSKANAAYWGGTMPWVSAKDMADFWLVDSEDHLTDEGVAAASRVVPAGSVLMLVRGMTLHKRVPICRVAKPVTFNQDVKAVLPKPGISSRFVPYLLAGNHDRLLARVDSAGHGTGRLNTETIANLEVWVPELPEQEQIADLAEAIDERIALLRETNATLEAIAQALFKSWFVDFDPVRAKHDGRAPDGMDEATAALFPDSFEDSELGEVPRGWLPCRLDSFLELAYGKALKAESRRPGPVPVYGSGGITGWHDTALVAEPSIVVGRKGTVGSLYWESRPFFPIDTVFYVRTSLPMSYCFELLKTLGLQGMNTDAAVPGLNRENVYRLLAPSAPDRVIAAFDAVVSSIRRRIDHNAGHAETLATLRDTLLPRLISGQLRLPQAQALTERTMA